MRQPRGEQRHPRPPPGGSSRGRRSGPAGRPRQRGSTPRTARPRRSGRRRSAPGSPRRRARSRAQSSGGRRRRRTAAPGPARAPGAGRARRYSRCRRSPVWTPAPPAPCRPTHPRRGSRRPCSDARGTRSSSLSLTLPRCGWNRGRGAPGGTSLKSRVAPSSRSVDRRHARADPAQRNGATREREQPGQDRGHQQDAARHPSARRWTQPLGAAQHIGPVGGIGLRCEPGEAVGQQLVGVHAHR